jgi:D-cysteine desulfhydrase
MKHYGVKRILNGISRMQIQSINKNIRVVRDDLFPFLGGGNKGRKILYIAEAIARENCTAVVSTGSMQSNHTRALAIAAALNNWQCTLVLHGNKDEFNSAGGNAKIMRLSGAKIIITSVDRIAAAMNDAMESYLSNGFKPYYVTGGGHTMEGGLAYIDAIGELREYCEEEKWFPDFIFMATGTGGTQSGILAGLDKFEMDSKVIGISVARKSERAQNIVHTFYKELCAKYNILNKGRESIVLDDYLCGGYEKYNEQILAISLNAIKEYGFVLDTTYTGKAFYGMMEYIKQYNINKRILFWHTGGIFNFLA